MVQETPIVLMRNSERSTFRRCALKWDWSYNRKLTTPRTKGALAFGSLVHAALELYYPPGLKRGPHPAETFSELYVDGKEEFDQWDEEGNRIPAYDLGVGMLEGYVREYGADETVRVIEPEVAMQIDVMREDGSYICTWVGQGDAAYQDMDTGRYGFLEHKTAKTIPEEVPLISGYGDQALSYFWSGSLFFAERNIEMDHGRFNWLKKQLPDDRPRNALGHVLNKPSKTALMDKCNELGVAVSGTVAALTHRLLAAGLSAHDIELLGEPSKRQPEPLFHRFRIDFFPGQLEGINKRIRDEAELMRMTRAGEMPIVKNPTRDCRWECEFSDACEIHEMGGSFEDVLELEMASWDPYEAHREYLGEM